jgi:hypothetical protein
MPGRSSSSGRSSSFSRSRSSSSSYSSRSSSKPSYSYSSPKSPVSAPTPYTPPSSTVHHNHQVQQPGFFSNMWQGFGLGAGQSIAMNIFRSDPKVTHVHENTPAAPSSSQSSSVESFYSMEYSQCMKDKWDDKETCKQYIQCLKDNKDDKSLCKQYM